MNITKLFLIFALSIIIGAATLFLFPLYVSLLMAILISVVSALILYIFFQSSEIEALDFDELENQIDDKIQSSNAEVLVSDNKVITSLSSFKISLYSLLLALFLYGFFILTLRFFPSSFNFSSDTEISNFPFLLFTILNWAYLVFLFLTPLFFIIALILKLFKGDIEITRGRIILFSIFLGLLGFTFFNPSLVMQIFFWIGGIIVALAVLVGPTRDNRFRTGYKDNASGDGWFFGIGIIFLVLGGLIYWLTQ